jgi:transposase
LDLRERIVRAVEAGTPPAEVARTVGVGRATVERYVRRNRAGTLAPRTSPGRPRRIGPAATPALCAQLAATPDATLAEHVEQWARQQGMRVSVTTMHRAIVRVGWTRKKSLFRRANETR